MALAWSVVHTRAGRELAASIEITSQGFPVFYPLHRRTRHHNHQLETIIGPLFPRYVFVEFDREQSGWEAIKADSRHVCSILKDMLGRPRIVPSEAMTVLRNRLEVAEEAAQRDPEYAVGQRVKIINGNGQGFEALFEGSAKERTVALLSLMGRHVRVSMQDITAA